MEKTSPIGCAAISTVVFLLIVLGSVLYENPAWLRSNESSAADRSYWPDKKLRHEMRREHHGIYFETIETTWRRDGSKESEIRCHELTPDREERRFWNPDGSLDWEKSGVYDRGKRILALESEVPRRPPAPAPRS